MKKFILLSFTLGALASTIISCGSPPEKEKSSASTSPDGSVDSLTEDTALYLNVSTNWENSTVTQSFQTCSMTTLVAPETVQTCNVTIPEGQLYYSDINFLVGTKIPAMCPVIAFYPYYHLRSMSATYKPVDETSFDCSGSKYMETPECWGGAAPQIIPNFPKNFGWYHLPAVTTYKTYTLPAENTTRWYGNRSKKNFGATNNLPDASRNATIASKPYVVDTTTSELAAFTKMHDYFVVCEDLWAHPIYTIKLNIIDEDTQNSQGTLDEVEDWLTP
jgi:hypothetical protein